MKLNQFSFKNSLDKFLTCRACIIYGDDSGQLNIIEHKIIKKFIENNFCLLKINVDQITNDTNYLRDNLDNFDFLNPKKIFVLSELDVINKSFIKTVKNYILSDNDLNNFILITSTALKYITELKKDFEFREDLISISCYKTSNNNVEKFIETELLNNSIKYDSSSVELILHNIGDNKLKIMSEIKKLSISIGENRRITSDIIDKYIGSYCSYLPVDLCRSLGNKNSVDFINIFQNLVSEGYNMIVLLRYLLNYFDRIVFIKNDLSKENDIDKIIEAYKPKIFFKDIKYIKQHVYLWTKESACKLIDKIIEAEIFIKSGVSKNNNLIITMLVKNIL